MQRDSDDKSDHELNVSDHTSPLSKETSSGKTIGLPEETVLPLKGWGDADHVTVRHVPKNHARRKKFEANDFRIETLNEVASAIKTCIVTLSFQAVFSGTPLLAKVQTADLCEFLVDFWLSKDGKMFYIDFQRRKGDGIVANKHMQEILRAAKEGFDEKSIEKSLLSSRSFKDKKEQLTRPGPALSEGPKSKIRRLSQSVLDHGGVLVQLSDDTEFVPGVASKRVVLHHSEDVEAESGYVRMFDVVQLPVFPPVLVLRQVIDRQDLEFANGDHEIVEPAVIFHPAAIGDVDAAPRDDGDDANAPPRQNLPLDGGEDDFNAPLLHFLPLNDGEEDVNAEEDVNDEEDVGAAEDDVNAEEDPRLDGAVRLEDLDFANGGHEVFEPAVIFHLHRDPPEDDIDDGDKQ